MANKIQTRRDIAAVWAAVNPILADGELAIETDTRYLKFGDGTTPWNALLYVSFPTSQGTALSITGTAPAGTIGLGYAFTPNIAGGTGPYSVSNTGAALPTGTTLNVSTGAITGTLIGSPASYAGIVLHVVDALGASANLALPTIVIASGGAVVVAPTITSQPTAQSVTAPATATFSVTASNGGGALSYQWQKNGTAISGATAASYTTPATSTADSGAVFQVVVTNSAGSVTSTGVALTVAGAVVVAPTITAQPAAQSVTAPATASFTVAATNGGGTLSYQWTKNGSNISGATSASYTTPATSTADTGALFRCVVTNSAGSVTSNAGTLTVAAPAADSRARFGVGAATAGVTSPAALLAAMTAMTGSANASKAGTFTVAPGTGQYGWAAFESGVSSGGVTFTDSLGTGGWQGASSAGNNSTDPGSSPNTSVVTYSDGTTTWRFFRQSYAAAGGSFTAS